MLSSSVSLPARFKRAIQSFRERSPHADALELRLLVLRLRRRRLVVDHRRPLGGLRDAVAARRLLGRLRPRPGRREPRPADRLLALAQERLVLGRGLFGRDGSGAVAGRAVLLRLPLRRGLLAGEAHPGLRRGLSRDASVAPAESAPSTVQRRSRRCCSLGSLVSVTSRSCRSCFELAELVRDRLVLVGHSRNERPQGANRYGAGREVPPPRLERPRGLGDRLGSWLTYGGGVAREQAEACVARAFDEGINFIDTANVYARGAAEEFLGEVLAGRPRDSLRARDEGLLPDVRRATGASRASRSSSRSTPRSRACGPTTSTSTSATATTRTTPLEETMEALTEVVRAGQGALHRLLRVDARADPRRARPAPASSASSRASRSTRCSGARRSARSSRSARARHLADRLVAARPGRAQRQVPAGRAAAAGLARGERLDGRVHGQLLERRRARGRPAAAADRGRARPDDGAARARVGAAASPRSPPRSSARAGPSRSPRTPPRRASSSTRTRSRAIDDALGRG